MLIFLISLVSFQAKFKRIPTYINTAADFFLPLLPLFILPSCIGIIHQLELLKNDGIKLFIALFIGMLITQIITPLVFIRVNKYFNAHHPTKTNVNETKNSEQ